MTEVKYLIIGGGVAGTMAADTIRKKDSEGSITIISDEPYRFYSKIMLSKPAFFLGKIPFETIWLRKEEWYPENKISLLLGKKAVSLDPVGKIVALDDGASFKYEKLLLATGSSVIKWLVVGADKNGICYLRTLDDVKKIMQLVKTAKRAATIGGGFISFEMADLLRLSGKDVTLIIRENYFWEPILDEESGRLVEKVLKDAGVEILYKSEAKEILGGDSVESILLNDGRKVEAEMVVCGIGVRSENEWLAGSGLKINKGILANEYLETNLPDVWAAGDVAEYYDPILGETVKLGNWIHSQEQGKRAGFNMAGEKEPFKFVSFYASQGLGVNIAFIGNIAPLPGRSVITRKYDNGKAIIRFIQSGNKIVGATLINKTEDLKTIANMIENNIDVSDRLEELSDVNFNLSGFNSENINA